MAHICCTHIVRKTRAVAEAVKEKDFEKAMSLRDPEFIESLEGFTATSVLEKNRLPPQQVGWCAISLEKFF